MDVKRLGGFSSHHGRKLGCGPEHMAGERVRWHFQESSFFQRESIFRREEFKRAENSRGRGEVCPGYLTSALRPHPNGCLDQLDPMLDSGCCFVAPPNQ